MVYLILTIIIAFCAVDCVFYLKKIHALLDHQFASKDTTKDE